VSGHMSQASRLFRRGPPFRTHTMEEYSEHVWHLSASEEDQSVELKAFLEAHQGVDVNLHRNTQIRRALHCTALRGHAASTRLLIDAKADMEARDERGVTSLSLASSMGNLDCVEVLIESKADVRPAVRTATDRGHTPSHSASNYGH
jgi:ankyrin repeat protein